MNTVRILVVDDSVAMRMLIKKFLSTNPAVEVVGVAANGLIALAKIPQINPDVIILDVEMPEMDGLETLKNIRQIYPKLPVIMFSSLTRRGAITTLDALFLGATDYVTKPDHLGSIEESSDYLRRELLPKVESFIPTETARSPVKILSTPSNLSILPLSPLQAYWERHSKIINIVAVGTSTGGPNALSDFLSNLPDHFPAPVVVVQHMPPLFTEFLAKRLDKHCPLPVREAYNGAELTAGSVWIAPGDYHLEVEAYGKGIRLITHQGPPENSCRPSADVLFRSVAGNYGSGVLAVVMTGMGQDGLRGCRQIKDSGGVVYVQDQATSVVWGMAGAVAKEGLADKILPLNQLGNQVAEKVLRSRK